MFPRQCSLGAAAGYLLFVLTATLLMTSSHSEGPMAKWVADLVEVCKVLWGGRMRKANPSIPPVPFNAATYTSTKPLRIGYYVDEYAYPHPHPSVVRAVHEAVAALTAQGHTCVPFRSVTLHAGPPAWPCSRTLMAAVRRTAVSASDR